MLTGEDYWRLRDADLACEAVQQEAVRAALECKRRLVDAQRRRSQLYEAYALRYQFDPTQVYTFDDQGTALVRLVRVGR